MVRSVEAPGRPGAISLGTQPGQPLDSATIEDDVRRLWATGRFQDIRVESAESAGGADVVFRVVEKERLYLREVRFEPAGQKRAVRIQRGAPIDERLAQQAAVALRKQLVEEGHKDAKVEADLVPAGSRRADLLLRVEPGERYRIGKVRFTGDIALEPKDLSRSLRALRVRRLLPGIKSRPPFVEAAIPSDLERLRSLYLSRGYIDVQVRLDRVEHKEGRTAVTIGIDAGPRYNIREITVAARGEPRKLEGPKREEPAVRELCDCLLRARRDSEEEGRIDFDARLEARIEPDREARLAAEITAGPPYTVGRIEFRGNHSFSDSTVRRAFVLDEGALFDWERLLRSLVRLNRLGMFEPVTMADVMANREEATRRVNLTVFLRQKPRGRWFLSGPVGPPALSGPLTAAVASRLPGWGRGIFETSTYYVTLSVSAFANPFLRLAPLAAGSRWIPLFSLGRPLIAGQGWTSGFAISPQLGWKGMLASYGANQLHRGVRGLLRSDAPAQAGLVVPVERVEGGDAKPAGFLICEPERSRWAWLRTAGTIAADWLLVAAPL